jgi:hypothetical protein
MYIEATGESARLVFDVSDWLKAKLYLNYFLFVLFPSWTYLSSTSSLGALSLVNGS